MDERLMKQRERLFDLIRRDLALDGYSKVSEGEVSVHAPGYHHQDDGWTIQVYCYTFGPTRRHYFGGDTLDECMDLFDAALDEWAAEVALREQDEAVSP